jgi:hypothetical protein
MPPLDNLPDPDAAAAGAEGRCPKYVESIWAKEEH